MKRALIDLTAKASLLRSATVTPEALNVAPHLMGAPLATPVRRVMAMAIDLVLIAFFSKIGNLPFLAGLALVAFQLRSQPRTGRWLRQVMLWAVSALLVWQGLQSAVELLQESVEPTVTTRQTHRPGATQRNATGNTTANTTDHADAAKIENAENALQVAHDRIEELEVALKEAQTPKLFRWRSEMQHWLDSLGIGFAWAIVYFSLLPVWLEGQTVGKKLLRLRVVELTGKPLTALMCFGRYGGYVAGMATGTVGFFQMLWDDNRQAVQDKIAHTVVLDLRAPRGPTPPA